MLRLEDIRTGATIVGVEPGQSVRVVGIEPVGDRDLVVYYKTRDGRLRERRLTPDDSRTLSRGDAWASDAASGARGDPNERLRSMLRLEHDRRVLELLVRGAPLTEVLETLVLAHEEVYSGTLGSVLLLDGSGRRLRCAAAPSLPREYNDAIDGAAIGPAAGSCGTAAFRGKTVIVTDIATDPLWADYKDVALPHGLRACWSTPIVSSRGPVLGTFALYYREVRAPRPHELAAIEASAALAAMAIDHKQAGDLLRTTNERLVLATRAVGMGVWDLDLASRGLVWDERMFQIHGIQADRFGGTQDDWAALIHADDRKTIMAELTDALAGRSGFHAQYRVVLPDGATRHVETHGCLQRDGGGQPRHLIGVTWDVTEKKELQTQVLRAHRLESVGRLASGIAHDLNNILAPMLMGPQLLRATIDDPAARGLLDTIETSAARGAAILRQLLTFSRGTGGRRIQVQLHVVVGDMMTIVRETFPRNIVPRREQTGEPWPVLGDPTQLHQVLMNLCVNARDAMPDGGALTLGLRNVEVDEEMARLNPGARPGPHVELSVQDEGTGLPPEHLERLFDPFFTTKEVGRGTGLGLATALGIVRSHGGFIRVESEQGKGARFSVYLPAAEGADARVEPEPAAEQPRGNGELVLVVDDEEAVGRMLRMMLEKSGYRVAVAQNGSEAMTIYLQHRTQIQVIVTDLMMPVMDGAAFIRAVQNLDPDTAIVAMTGNENALPAELSGQVAGVLQKPFTMPDLLRVVQQAMPV